MKALRCSYKCINMVKTSPLCRPSRMFIDPHIRDIHPLGKNGSGIGIAGPSPNRDIQKNVEGMVVNPICLVCESSSIQSGIVNTIHKEVKVVGIPLQRKDVKDISENPVLQLVRTGEISWTMHRSMNNSWL